MFDTAKRGDAFEVQRVLATHVPGAPRHHMKTHHEQ